MDTPQRIGTIIAVALVVAFCTISDTGRYDRETKLVSDLQTLQTQLDELQRANDQIRRANNQIRIFLAAQRDTERVLSSLDELPFLSTLSDRQVAAITKVLTGMAPEAWARELKEETTLSETQIHQLLEALAPR